MIEDTDKEEWSGEQNLQNEETVACIWIQIVLIFVPQGRQNCFPYTFGLKYFFKSSTEKP